MQDITEIAKLIRADLKAAQKTGQLGSELAFSVRCSRFSQGQAINVRVTGYTGVRSPANPYYKALVDAVEALVAVRVEADGPRWHLYTDVSVSD